MKTHFKSIVVLFSILAFSCKKDVGRMNYGDYPADVGFIMANSCAVSGCHNSSSYLAANGYNLETWKSMFQGSGSGSPVIPYNSKFSSLCYFINTYADLGSQNSPTMPLNKNPLSSADVKLIKDWIDQGAPDIKGNIMWADDPSRKKLYAVNQGCDIVTVFDSETQLPIRYIEVGNKPGSDTPHHVKVSPDGNYWYVIFINNNIMQKFRCSDDSYVGDIPLTPLAAGKGSENDLDWNTFVITKDSKKAYCVSWTANGRVAAVDLENRKLINYSSALYYPHAVALNETEDKVFVASQTGNFVTEIDTGFTDPNEISLQNGLAINYTSSLDPHDMLLSADKKNLIITCQKSNEVRVLNIPTRSVTAVIPTGIYPQEIAYSKTRDEYFVTCMEDNTTFPNAHGVLTRIKGTDYSASNIPCGFQPHGVAVDDRKKLVYVLSRNVSTTGPLPHHTSQCNGRNGFVNFIDLNTFTLLSKRYEMSVDPYYIYPRP